MPESLRILILEDSEADAELVLRELRRGGLEFTSHRVDSAEAMAAALRSGHWDAVIADYTMPGFTAIDALQVLREHELDLPFVIVSGTTGEAVAVEAMKGGAHDYLMKDNLTRLVPAVRREVREAAQRRQRRRAERELAEAAEARARYEFIVNTSRDFMSLVDSDYTYQAVNKAYCNAMQKTREEVIGRAVAEIWGPDTYDRIIKDQLERCFAGDDVQYEEWFEFGPLGRRYFHVCYTPFHNQDGVVTHVVVVSRDITERKLMEEELAEKGEELEQKRQQLERLVAQREAELERKTTDLSELRRQLKRHQAIAGMVGGSSEMARLFDSIRDVAAVNVPVLIQGESGTGKELVARGIHAEGPRADNAFIAVNCGALPEGLLESELFGHVEGAFTGAVRDRKGRFELADGGTIFLDEVADLPPAMQVKLLRVVQEGKFEPVGGERSVKVDVRLISATNKDLRAEVAAGRFREDLYYRLAVVPIHVPALRERLGDIPLLAEHVLARSIEKMARPIVDLADSAVLALTQYDWPGNVRELENAIQYALVRCKDGPLKAEHLPPTVTRPAAAGTAPGNPARKEKLTVERVRRALKAADGNKVRAARLLGVSRATLYRFLDGHDLAG
ncbi:MAG TPA: sigma 54-interacting transcriptional regulator [Phycisphaerae bacterium]|nr:sigma 54-interacting transcriptional regulator [Phycisphaerae bacterium]